MSVIVYDVQMLFADILTFKHSLQSHMIICILMSLLAINFPQFKSSHFFSTQVNALNARKRNSFPFSQPWRNDLPVYPKD